MSKKLESLQLIRFAGILSGLLSIGPAHANPELDHKYAFETIGALRAWDNVDGLFSDYVSKSYRDYFSKTSRFRWVESSKADAALTDSKMPFQKAIEDSEILAQLTRSLKMQTLLRTKIRKEGPQYQVSIEWLHSPAMERLSSETFFISEMNDLDGRLQEALNRLFNRVPIIGNISGRDGTAVTVNVGALSGIHRGDTLIVQTLEDVKKHPLLKEVVEWRLAPIGRLEVDEVEDRIAFCHVISEEADRNMSRYQKVTQIIPRPVTETKGATLGAEKILEPPRLGFYNVSLWTGTFGRNYSINTTDPGKSGSGILIGARGAGQLWLNRDIFFDLDLGIATFGYSQKDLTTGTESTLTGVSGTATVLKSALGYNYYLSNDIFGPKAWAKVGYSINNFNLAYSAADTVAPYSSSAIFLGGGADLPVRDRYGAKLDLELGVITNGAEVSSANTAANTSSYGRFYLGGYHRYRPKMHFNFGIEVITSGSTFSTGAIVSEKAFSFTPSVSFYF